MSDPASIEHRHLRSAIEYAVLMGEEIAKRKAPVSVPRELRSMSGKARIPTGSLGRLRRAIDGDETFRTAIAAGALLLGVSVLRVKLKTIGQDPYDKIER